MTWEALTASGNILLRERAANFSLNGRTVMGPAQDTYDWMLYQATSEVPRLVPLRPVVS
jgi:hypothetical protein